MGLLSQNAAQGGQSPGQGPSGPRCSSSTSASSRPLLRFLAASPGVPLGAEHRVQGFQSWALATSCGVLRTQKEMHSHARRRGAACNSGGEPISVTYIHSKTVPCVLCPCGKTLTFFPAASSAGNCPGGGIPDQLGETLGKATVTPTLDFLL